MTGSTSGDGPSGVTGANPEFLNQDLLSFQTEDSILSVAMTAFASTMEIQKQIDKTIKEMEENYPKSAGIIREVINILGNIGI